MNMLRNSIETSIEQVKSKEPLAIELFCLLGLLPNGISENDLTLIWKLRQK